MSLKNKLLLSTVSVSIGTAVITAIIFFFLFMFHLRKQVDTVYNDTTMTMTYIQRTLAKNSREIVKHLENCPDRDFDSYMILDERGILLGRVRNCTFIGTRFTEAVEFTSTVNRMQWFIMYSRDLLRRYIRGDEEFLDRFVEGKNGITDYIIEGYFNGRLARIARNVAGYRAIDNYRTLLIDYPIILEGSYAIGKVVFVKDFTPILVDVLITPAVFIFLTLSMVAVLSTVLLVIFNRIVRDILYLKEVTQQFGQRKFDKIRELNEIVRKTKTRDELFYLKKSIKDMATELETQLNHFKEKAYTDPLTGLSNRWFFFESATKFYRFEERRDEPVAVLMIDVDDFKKINDTYGHDVGDQVLKNLAAVIKGNVRSSDIAARFGGEEFIIFLPATNEEGAILVAERIRQGFKKLSVDVNGEKISTTVSIGIAVKEGKESLEELIKKADMALYEAKKHGKDKVVVFKGTEESPEQDSPVPESQATQ